MGAWAAVKAQARRQVHQTFAVRCLYRETQNATPVEVQARLHGRIQIGGNNGPGGGYAQIIEGVHQIIFDKTDLIAANIIPKRNAYVTFPDYGSNFQLDARDSDSGPVVEKWSLAGL